MYYVAHIHSMLQSRRENIQIRNSKNSRRMYYKIISSVTSNISAKTCKLCQLVVCVKKTLLHCHCKLRTPRTQSAVCGQLERPDSVNMFCVAN